MFTKKGNQDNYSLPEDARSKVDVFEDIKTKYTDDVIEGIDVKYDNIDSTTINGKRVIEPGSIVSVNTLTALKAELGKLSG